MPTLATLSALLHSPVTHDNLPIGLGLALGCALGGYWFIRRIARPR